MLPNWALFLSPAGWSIDIEAFYPLAVVLLLAPLFVLRRRGKSAVTILSPLRHCRRRGVKMGAAADPG